MPDRTYCTACDKPVDKWEERILSVINVAEEIRVLICPICGAMYMGDIYTMDEFEMRSIGYKCDACSHNCELHSDTLKSPSYCLASGNCVTNWQELKEEKRVQCKCGKISRYVSYKGEKMCEECYVNAYYTRERKKEKMRKKI